MTCTPDRGGGPGDVAAVRPRYNAARRTEIPPHYVPIRTDRDTYPVRETLRARGCLWDDVDRVWVRPPTVNVDDVLASAPERRAPAPRDTTGWRRVVGRTYEVRDRIKALGGVFDATLRAWLVPPDRYEEAQRLVPRSRYD